MAAGPTPRDRILAALAFEEADIVPYHLMLDEKFCLQLTGYFREEGLKQRITNHLPFYNLEPEIRWISADTYVDAFGSEWRSGFFPHLERAPLQEPSLAYYAFPQRFELEIYQKDIEDFLAQQDHHFKLCGIAYGFFDRGWALRGMENFLMDFVANPGFVHELFETLTNLYLDLIDRIAVYPFDGIRFGDDWGYQHGVLIGAERWRKFVKPGLKKIFNRAREIGLAVMVHSDGDVTELIPDLIEMGVQILNPLQPEAMDVLQIKAKFGRDLCLNGGISSQFTLPRGTADAVRREAVACLSLLGKGGGYVAGPAKALTDEVPLENAAALIDVLADQPAARHMNENQPQVSQEEVLRKVYTEFHPAYRRAPANVPENLDSERTSSPL